MKFSPFIVSLALMAALGAALIVFSHGRLETARADFAAARSERGEFDGKLRQARGEEEEIRRKAALFDRLRERGVVGEEPRLEWVELLDDIRDRRKLIEIHYEFSPRRALDDARTESFALHASAMKLQARLLHEEDLTRLLDDLRRQAGALIRIKRCDVSRPPRTDANNSLQYLQADCLIDWVTLREIKENQGETK